jgi:hypothetical protein
VSLSPKSGLTSNLNQKETMNDFATKKRSLSTPEARRELQLHINTATRSEAVKLGWGTVAQTFPENNRAPVPSKKGSCRKKRGVN